MFIRTLSVLPPTGHQFLFPQHRETTKITAELFERLGLGLLGSCSDSLRLSKCPLCNTEEASLLSRILVPQVLVPLFDDFRQINFVSCILSSFLVVLVDAASFLSETEAEQWTIKSSSVGAAAPAGRLPCFQAACRAASPLGSVGRWF